jgi:16S rRNA (uracil1498-N3)-methyltransferase
LLIGDLRLPRFFAPEIGGDLIDLPPEEAHHLTHVLRLGAGDEIAVFDGRGAERRARVERTGRRGARVRLLDSMPTAPEPRVALTLAQAILKGDRMDAVVRDATMLGVAAVQPLVTRRTIGRAPAARAGSARERWRRIAIASAKQCRRAVVPEVLQAVDFEEWVGGVEGGVILVEPGVPHHEQSMPDSPVSRAVLVVGPEGGWEAAELDAARRARFRPLTLGALTLRAEAAPLVAIAALRAKWGDF